MVPGPLTLRPAYLNVSREALAARARHALTLLADCRICPRDCGVNRIEDRWAACKTGRYAVVSSCFPHFGEEDCLRGWNGSGTIFFGHCNLRCVFCQNFDISQDIKPNVQRGSTPREIAAMMLWLQEQGCHNINFVTPEHVAPQVVEAVSEAIPLGLRLPIVYNTSAYDSLESIALLDGIVDIYMPDFKYSSEERSRTYMKAADYPRAARAAIQAMHAQVGSLVLDDDRLARGGDGIVCELEALAPAGFTLISERRRIPPRGRDGGADGSPGRDTLNGEALPAKAEGELSPGDRLRIETPGGGGHGAPPSG